MFANPNIQARTGILIDHHSNEILYEMDPDIEIYPASMTKIMTAIVAFDLLNKGKLSLDDKFTVSENAWRLSQAGYSSMFIMINDQVTVEDLLKGIIIASGNDACVALAEGIAGSEENFADMMNVDVWILFQNSCQSTIFSFCINRSTWVIWGVDYDHFCFWRD